MYVCLHTHQRRALIITPPHKISLACKLATRQNRPAKITLHAPSKNGCAYSTCVAQKGNVLVPVGAPGNEWVVAGRPSLALFIQVLKGRANGKGYKASPNSSNRLLSSRNFILATKRLVASWVMLDFTA